MKDTVVLITGGAKGIGRHIVNKMADRNVKIAITYHHSSELAQQLVKELSSRGIEIIAIKADVADHVQAGNAVNQVIEMWGTIDVLVNNAGIIRDKTLLMMASEEWQEVIQTNLSGVFNITQSCIFNMLKNKRGRVINLSSISGIVGTAGQTNYSASKAGIIGFSKALAKEVIAAGITVNVVAPGGVNTEMLASMSEKARTAMLQSIPAGRFCEPEEVAQVVEWLAFDSPLYLTGNVIVLDGGAGIG
jgi:3-oxoacyl-[acyl-carrier protein] reductase